MPIGGYDGLGWDETTPNDAEAISLGDDRIRSLKTSLRNVLDSEHIFSSGGGNGQGVHRLGSARVFVTTQSAMSSSGTDGRLGWASDSSRLFHVGSGGTVYLGGPYGLSVGTTTGVSWPQRSQWIQEFGAGITGSSSGSTLVTVPSSGFSGVPFWHIQSVQTSITPTNVTFIVYPIDGSTAVVTAIAPGAGTVSPNQPFQWFSIGTRTL